MLGVVVLRVYDLNDGHMPQALENRRSFAFVMVTSNPKLMQ